MNVVGAKNHEASYDGHCITMVTFTHPADVAELADALDSGSSAGNGVEVQVLSSAPNLTSLHE